MVQCKIVRLLLQFKMFERLTRAAEKKGFTPESIGEQTKTNSYSLQTSMPPHLKIK